MDIVGAVSSIVQILDFSTRVAFRLEEYRSSVNEFPEVFAHISAGLPLLGDSLRKIEQGRNNGNLEDASKKALDLVLHNCAKLMEDLEKLLSEVSVQKDDTALKKTNKVILSFSHEKKIKDKWKTFNEHIHSLMLHLQLSSTSAHASQPAPKPAPSPSFVCPFMRDPDFVERDVMNVVEANNKPGSRFALVGLGGVGKSQILIEYGYRIRDTAPQTWVFWVGCESVEQLKADYSKIAKTVNIPGWDSKGTNILAVVHDWLSNAQNGPWVIMLDNADALDVFTATASEADTGSSAQGRKAQVLDFLPVSSHGSILITSKTKEVAFKLATNYKRIQNVGPMTESEAAALVQNKLDAAYTDDDIKALVKALDYMPLAVSQAAAYISQMSPLITIAGYLKQLEEGDQERQKLLEKDLPELGRDTQRSNSIIATWQLSFKYVREKAPSAARLLSLMCLFERQNIPKTLLIGSYDEKVLNSLLTADKLSRRLSQKLRYRKKRKEPQSWETQAALVSFQSDWAVLMDFSLIQTNADGTHFSMHAMVQFTTQRWLAFHHEIHLWIHVYLTLIDSHMLPNKYWQDPLAWERLMAHAARGLTYIEDTNLQTTLRIWADVVFKIARHLEYNKEWEISKELYCKTLKLCEAFLGATAPETLRSNLAQAACLTHLGRYSEAEHAYRAILDIQQKKLGHSHLDTLDTMDKLADILDKEGQHDEAEKLHTQALKQRLRTVGSSHRKYQCALKSRGLAQKSRGEHSAAYETFRQLYDVRRMNREKQHGLKNLRLKARAMFKHDPRAENRSFDTARSFFTSHPSGRLLQQYYRSLGYENHTDYLDNMETLEIMFDLAGVLESQQKLTNVENLAREVLQKSEEIYGETDPTTAMCIWVLADILRKQKRLEEAVALYYRAYLVGKETYGEQHEDTRHVFRGYKEAKEELQRTAQGSSGTVDAPEAVIAAQCSQGECA